ncbi:MAG: YhcH/YjgK/YiaL family protein [Candidatus Omnitrophota bacterium]
MIVDQIKHLSRYAIPLKKEILDFLFAHRAQDLPVGEIEIKGRDLFVRTAEYMTRLPHEGRFETHQVYMDLQYVVAGAEIMQFAPRDVLLKATAYDEAGDYQFFTADRDITDVLVREGEFVVYFPGEAHRPMCQRGKGPEAVKKLVFKIKMS